MAAADNSEEAGVWRSRKWMLMIGLDESPHAGAALRYTQVCAAQTKLEPEDA